MRYRDSKTFRMMTAALAAIALLLTSSAVEAVTRAELAVALWDALGYAPAPEMKLPPDVPVSHEHAKKIGHAGRYGLIPLDEAFMPDEEVDRHNAMRLALRMMGWGFELSLYESLSILPEFGGSGDTVFFMAAEMRPPAPQGLLVDGATPLSPTGRDALAKWAASCAEFVQWNRAFPYGGTELILFRQGVARPGVKSEPRDINPIGARPCEPMYIAAVAVHPGEVDTRTAFAEPFGAARVPPTLFSAAYDATAVVNGGFFYGGRPIGTMLINGEHAGKPIMGRSAIGWNNGGGTTVFGRGGARVGVKIGGGFVELSNFNTAPKPDEAVLCTPDVSSVGAGLGAARDALIIVASGGVVVERREAADLNWGIPRGCVLVAATGTARRAIEGAKPGDDFRVMTEWETRSFAECSDLIQGGPMLLRGGQFTTDAEGVKPDITDKRHPRTIVGTDGSRVIWAVVDGRSSLHSRGATIAETRWIARALGMTTALNLDGGGSSQLVWRGILANSPSDGRERPLPYAVVMVPRGSDLVWRAPSEFDEYAAWAEFADGTQGTPRMEATPPGLSQGTSQPSSAASRALFRDLYIPDDDGGSDADFEAMYREMTSPERAATSRDRGELYRELFGEPDSSN